MPNKFLTPDIIANEALMVLENNTVMAGLVHRDYSKEFNHVGDTITIRKPGQSSSLRTLLAKRPNRVPLKAARLLRSTISAT